MGPAWARAWVGWQGRLEFKWLSFLSDEKMRGMDSTGAQQDRVRALAPRMPAQRGERRCLRVLRMHGS